MTLGIVGVGFLAAIAGIAFMVLKNSSPTTGSVSQSLEKPDLELIEHRTVNINFFHYVTGTIRNNTKKTYDYVQVQVAIYNNEILMGTSMASAKNLKPGDKWDFQVPVLEQGAYQYKFTNITGEKA